MTLDSVMMGRKLILFLASISDFYQQLSGAFDELPAHDVKFLLGDLNARIGQDNSAWSGVIGKHSLHISSNDNGLRLLDFCALHQLTIGGTLFQHRDIHKGSWKSPDGGTVNQIDHVCISTKWSHSLLEYCVSLERSNSNWNPFCASRAQGDFYIGQAYIFL